ncbi:heteromeric Ino2p/Ino4p transcription factor [Microdochium nivale]|nr:heteromeric Ino2p/Ino4p transcription factor [Microdochium nivale]
MTENGSSSPQNGTDSANADDKPRLTEEEKKQNHIASEQKRREAIRAGFDRLCDIVPGLDGQGRSEGLVLKKTVDYMREQMEVRRQLILAKEARGEYVPDEMREAVVILERIEAREQREMAMKVEDCDDS